MSGLFGSKPSPPSPEAGIPSAQHLASDQTTLNTGAQAASNYNQSNPFGFMNFTQTGVGPGGVPTYGISAGYSPEQQALYDLWTGAKGQGGLGANALLGGAAYGAVDPTTAIGNSASGIVGDVIGKETQAIAPFQQTARSQLDAQLRNQGFTPGTPAYDNAMRGLDMTQNLAVTQMIGQTTPQAYQTASQLYTMPAQMAMALSNFGMPVNPNTMFGQGAALQPANEIGAYGNTQNAIEQQYAAQMQQYQNTMSGIMGIPTALLYGYGASPAGSAAIGSMFASI